MERCIRAAGYALLLTFFVNSYAKADAALTQRSLEKMIQELESAASKKDIEGVLKHLSPEVRITGTVRRAGETKTIAMDYETYKASLKQRWATPMTYTYKREKWDAKFSADQKNATVNSVIYESYVINGRSTSGRTRETLLIKLVNSKPMIMEVSGGPIE